MKVPPSTIDALLLVTTQKMLVMSFLIAFNCHGPVTRNIFLDDEKQKG